MTFEKDELGTPFKEKPDLSAGTPDTARKTKSQTQQGSPPGPRQVEGTPTSRVQDPSSPCTAPAQAKLSPAPAAAKDTPGTAAARSSTPAPSEERKAPPPGSQHAKGPPPRKVALHTLQAWSKTPR